MSTKAITFSFLTALSMLTAGCGNVSQGPSPSVVRITLLEAASGAKPDLFRRKRCFPTSSRVVKGQQR